MIYLNDNEPFIKSWVTELVAAGELPPCDFDDSSIKDISADALAGYTECHFFAGIGGWPLALRMAGWPAGRGVWTGSCPCQPFSVAGQRKGTADDRHLWPAFRDLIAKRRPATIFGEQVASKDGRIWLAGVRADLEAHWDMQSGPPICALRASGRRTSDSGFTGWPTAMAGSKATETYNEAGNTDSSRKTVALVGRNTARATDGKNGGPNQAGGALSHDAQLAGWSTASATDWKDQANEVHGTYSPRLGQQALLFLAPTGNSAVLPAANRARLNPAFSLWLMGFPIAWAHCAAQVTPSSRKSRRSSSGRS